MALEYRLLVQHRVVVTVGTGTLAPEDFAHARRVARADPAFEPSFMQLMDFRRVTRVALDAESVAALANESMFRPGVRKAIVASTDVAFGLARMYEALADSRLHQSVEVFRDAAEALRWLGLPENLLDETG